MKTCRMFALLALCYCESVALSNGQDGSKIAQPSNAPSTGSERAPMLEVYSLKHVGADQALHIAQDLLVKRNDGSGKTTRFAVDAQKNSLIVYGDRETQTSVRALLLNLDKPDSHSERPEPKLRIINLEHANPNEVVRALEQLSIKGIVAKYADERTKALIVKGTDDALAQLKVLVDRLDVAAPSPRAADAALRILWLVDKSLTTSDTPPVPADLNAWIEKLRKKVGIGELRMAAQMVVNINPDEPAQFNAVATSQLNQPIDLRVTGVITSSGGESRLNLQLDATDQKKHEQLSRVNTTCSAVLQGQPVMVGMTTVNSQPSVFVIQLLPK